METQEKSKKELSEEIHALRELLTVFEKNCSDGNSQLYLKLEKRHQFLQSIIDGVADPIIVVGTDMRIKLKNLAARLFAIGSESGEVDGTHCYELLFGREKPCENNENPCPFIEVLETGLTVSAEHKREGKDGTVQYYEILASPLLADDGTNFGVIEIFRDITDRKLVQEKLRIAREESEEMVRKRTAELLRAKEHADLVYRVIPSAIFTVDRERLITSWNDKAEAVTGFAREEVIGKPCSMFALYPCTERCGVFSEYVPKPILGKQCEIKTKNGQVRTVSKNADHLIDASGNVIGAVESFEDITDFKQVEEELRTERDKFRGMLTAMAQGMHILNKDFDIEYQNDVLRRAFGDKIGHKCYEVYKKRDKPCEVCRMHAAIESNEVQRTEEVMANGRYYEQSYAPFTDVDGKVKTLILLRDITEEKAYQAETMRAGQLASIGELAAGVAHEINNPINGIINYAQLMLDEAQDDHDQSEMLERLIKEGERIADIVKNLLAFSRQRDREIENVSLVAVIGDCLALIRHQFMKDGIRLVLDIPEELPVVPANPQQLQQVFLNLLSNSRHALNQRYKGADVQKRIEIVCSSINYKDKPYVRTCITDYGAGIPKEIIGKIFDPFFSSKKPGEGTGLGLSISHGLIREFHGFIRVESEEGSYTTVTVELPASPA